MSAPEELLEELAEESGLDLECVPAALEQYGREMTARFPGTSAANFSIPSRSFLRLEGTAADHLLEPYEHMWLPFKVSGGAGGRGGVLQRGRE